MQNRKMYIWVTFLSKYVTGAEYTLSDDGSSGENYPGISLYHDGMDLVAIVSTGDDVWKLQVNLVIFVDLCWFVIKWIISCIQISSIITTFRFEDN